MKKHLIIFILTSFCLIQVAKAAAISQLDKQIKGYTVVIPKSNYKGNQEKINKIIRQQKGRIEFESNSEIQIAFPEFSSQAQQVTSFEAATPAVIKLLPFLLLAAGLLGYFCSRWAAKKMNMI